MESLYMNTELQFGKMNSSGSEWWQKTYILKNGYSGKFCVMYNLSELLKTECYGHICTIYIKQ